MASQKQWPPQVCSPCGAEVPHCFCRQFGYCIFGQTPTEAVADTTEKVNAVLVAASTWCFVAFAVVAAVLYKPGDVDMNKFIAPAVSETFNKVFAIAIIGNSSLSILPTSYNTLICNIFRAKVIANQVWCMVNLMAFIAFYTMTFQGYAFMMFAMGWSVSMFVITAKWALPYAAAVAFLIITPLLCIPKEATSGFYYAVMAACWMLGFMTWSSMEGYTHIHQFSLYPDARVWAWKGPVTIEVPTKKDVPTAWGEDVPTAWGEAFDAE